MTKYTLTELEKNKKDWKRAVIVFTEDSFDKEYPLEARSYEIFSDDNYFDPSKISTSLSGSSLDGNDYGIRLDIYLKEGWTIDYCYIVE